jgi:hypothetical protein
MTNIGLGVIALATSCGLVVILDDALSSRA